MHLNIDDKSEYPQIIINAIYKLFMVENVLTYSLINYNTHHIEVYDKYINTEEVQSPQYYFPIDLIYHDAFGHWVYESAIYLPLFHSLKQLYPNIKLVLKEKKKYKWLFLKFFSIQESDVIYDSEMQKYNICLFPSPISSLNDNEYFNNTYTDIINNFIQLFNTINIPAESKKYDCIVMPRQTKENYIGNNRFYSMDFIYRFIEDNSLTYFTLNTDDIDDLTEQIKAIQSATTVILTDGSPFHVNLLFCKHQRIHIIDTITQEQQKIFQKKKYTIETVSKLNNCEFHYIPIKPSNP